ncbi:MAG: hypothetical protein OXU61_13085 [Gammaproteobacteria bacterium]|nr:hypothetical protein [Gammaproteobacteria bacterium]
MPPHRCRNGGGRGERRMANSERQTCTHRYFDSGGGSGASLPAR